MGQFKQKKREQANDALINTNNGDGRYEKKEAQE